MNSSRPDLRTEAALAACIVLLMAAGCASSDPRVSDQGKPERGRDGTIAYLVQVEASEPGVRIEADGDSIGITPLTLKVFGDKDGTFHNFGNPEYVITAYPARNGQMVQRKVYGTGAWFGREDRIPSKVYFEMDLVSGGNGAASSPAPPPSPPPPSRRASPEPGEAKATGTGFAITEDGYLVTNHHVVRDARRIIVIFPDERVEARLEAKDLRNDLAILKVLKRTSPLPLGSSGSVRLGEEVGTLGFPRPEDQGIRVKFSRGTVSSLTGLEDDVAQFQISAPTQPGNSGGPLINTRGEVIGVVSSTLSPLRTFARDASLPQAVNYAVKTAYLRLLLETVPGISIPSPQAGVRSAKPFEELLEVVVPSVVLVESYY